MPRQPWTNNRCDFPTLRVGAFAQPFNESDCVTYSLLTVASYIANEYPDEEVRLKTNVPLVDEIKGHIRTDELGWRPNQADLTDISALISSVRLSLDEWPGEPPRRLLEIAQDFLDRDLPLIVLIDDLQLRRGIRGSGPLHAVTIVGVSPSGDEVAIADPWFGEVRQVSEAKLEDAWDPMHHQVIKVEVAGTSIPASGDGE